jgi:trafficking protein particle complex subunit 11
VIINLFGFGKVFKNSRRHRVLAELLEQGTRSTLVIPVHKPASSNSSLSQSQQNLKAAPGVEYDTLRSLGINPSHALQHPGFYYYMAARCTEMRRSRFLAAVESEVNPHCSFYLVTVN